MNVRRPCGTGTEWRVMVNDWRILAGMIMSVILAVPKGLVGKTNYRLN